MARAQRLFVLVVLAQAAHSVEEYAFELWNTLPPARFLSGLVSSDLERGFVTLTVVLLLFGAWCILVPVGRHWPSARPIMWGWALVEMTNGIVHPAWSLLNGHYTAGTLTAPIVGLLGLLLARELSRTRDRLPA
jgi:hypothetical protein